MREISTEIKKYPAIKWVSLHNELLEKYISEVNKKYYIIRLKTLSSKISIIISNAHITDTVKMPRVGSILEFKHFLLSNSLEWVENEKYKTIILPVLLQVVKHCLLTLRERCILRVYENRITRRIFGSKRDYNVKWRIFFIWTTERIDRNGAHRARDSYDSRIPP